MMKKFVQKSSREAQSTLEVSLLGIPVAIVSEPTVSFAEVAIEVEKILPQYLPLAEFIDGIYVGSFDVLKQRQINALYHEGAIYVTNEQSSIQDAVDDIVHEMAHVLEEVSRDDVYADGEVEREFIRKRSELFERLMQDPRPKKILEPLRGALRSLEFDPELDRALFQDIGYELIATLAYDLFVDPYAVTSIREYFATGFEFFYLEDKSGLKILCPKLYDKLSSIDRVMRKR